ncbi:MAG TPA: FKBP-type peptidyl-prolyl cis-trans isomerase [Gemmatimonadaceae bacterium]|jgi:FKBP-type peptidyl-prolyl cis-trans isomerase|nr:FKBP-type peptidyl-prolyl cis-trans isomerase [Gemmatimonadaceae bacterium]
MRLSRALSLLAPLAFAACLSGTDPVTFQNIPIESTTFSSNLNVNLAASTKLPSGMYYRDIIVGTGKTVATGDSIAVYYQGAFTNGQLFDQRLSPSPAFEFKLGANRVIPGWDEGLVGTKVGGVRQLIIPPSLAYGSSGSGPIPPYAVLVFNVTISNDFTAGP